MSSVDKMDGLLAALLAMPAEDRRRALELDKPVHDPGRDHRLTPTATPVGTAPQTVVKARAKAPLMPGVVIESNGDVTVSVLIRFDGDIGHLAQEGVKVRAVIGDVASVDIPLDALARVASDDHVVYIEAIAPVLPLLDTSVPEVIAGSSSLGSGGRDVVVAVIDMYGLDLYHPDFAGRIERLWDQNADLSSARRGRIPSLGDGVVFDSEDIAADAGAPMAYSLVPCAPTGKHGTHVAGIAVGSGDASKGIYRGVAPEADLMFVNLCRGSYESSDNRYLFHALSFVDAAAGSAPCAVNISLGWASGPRDGTSNLERTIDHIASKPGRAVIVAAGNEGGSRRYLTRALPRTGDLDLTLVVPPRTEDNERIEIWYPRGDDVSVTLLDPLGLDPLGPVSAGEHVAQEMGGARVVVANGGAKGLDRCILIMMMPLRPELGAPRLRSGGWTVRLSRTAGQPAPVEPTLLHATIFGITSMTWDGADDRSSLTSPATARGAITVGNYLHRAGGHISSTSSVGPARGGGGQKPDLAAPGTGIKAPLFTAYPSLRGESYVCCSGTSMAAPHVTGLVARIFSDDPSLTGAEVKARLKESADRASLAPGWDPAFGWGRARAPQRLSPHGVTVEETSDL